MKLLAKLLTCAHNLNGIETDIYLNERVRLWWSCCNYLICMGRFYEDVGILNNGLYELTGSVVPDV